MGVAAGGTAIRNLLVLQLGRLIGEQIIKIRAGTSTGRDLILFN